MQPNANGKCDVESAPVQKQPGSTKTKEYYEATILFFCHACMVLLMHHGLHGQGKPYSMFLHDSNLDPALTCHLIFLTVLGCVCWWIDNMVAIKKPLHHVLVGILAFISIIVGVFLSIIRFPTSLPDFASIEATYCLNRLNSYSGTLYSFILRNYWLLEISFVLVDSLSILAEGTVIVAAFSWWRLSREMMVPSKSSA
uniref:Uncharacterized protein n=1 Tax=Daphnia galeata TaxID=27404 RepID=A0A8J2WCF2_9CRUS|nr:unnamed protein product [Daphnia galeata]